MKACVGVRQFQYQCWDGRSSLRTALLEVPSGILQVKTAPDGKLHLDSSLATDDHERHVTERSTLEWTSFGALNGDIKVSQVLLMWFGSDPWCGVGNESFCLLLC